MEIKQQLIQLITKKDCLGIVCSGCPLVEYECKGYSVVDRILDDHTVDEAKAKFLELYGASALFEILL